MTTASAARRPGTPSQPDRELEAAGGLLRQLLPDALPEVGLLDTAVSSDPAAFLSGDFYDLIPFPDGRAAIVLGDVSGKGAAAALYAAHAIGIIRALAASVCSPDRMLERVNRALMEHRIEGRHLALTYGIWDPVLCRLHVAGSGLPHAIRACRDRLAFVDTAGIPLNLFWHSRYRRQDLDLEEGEYVVFYTDGVVDQRSPSGEAFGRQRLSECISRSRNETPQDVLEAIRSAVEVHSQGRAPSDDRTMLVIRMQRSKEDLGSETLTWDGSVRKVPPLLGSVLL